MDNFENEIDYDYEIDTDAIIAKKSFVVGKDKMSARFLTGLKQYNLTYEEIVNSNWRYVGGDGGEVARNLFMNGTYFQIKKEDSKYNRCHLNYWILCFPNEELPDYTDRCVCDHPIIENCYISNKDDSEILVLGNCCIERFIPLKGRTCKLCTASHKNRKVNLCNECRLLCTDCKTTINNKKDVKCEKCVDKDYQFQCGNCEIMLDLRVTKYKYCSKCDDILSKKICGICNIKSFDSRKASKCNNCLIKEHAKKYCIKCKYHNKNFEKSNTCDSCFQKAENLKKLKNKLCAICNINTFDGRKYTNCDTCEKLKHKLCTICNINNPNQHPKCDTCKKLKNQICFFCNDCEDCNDDSYQITCEICKIGKYDCRFEYPESCCETPSQLQTPKNIKICSICNVNTFNSSIWKNCTKCSVQKLIKNNPIKTEEKPVIESVDNKCQKCDAILKNPAYKFCFKCFGNCIICNKKVDPRFKKCYDCNKYNKTSRDVEIIPLFNDKIEEPYPY